MLDPSRPERGAIMSILREGSGRLALLAAVAGLLAACGGVTPMKSYPVPGSELDPSKPGLLSGEDGAITLYERK
jgi:hypothetical protein